jgi:hypothetical protein
LATEYSVIVIVASAQALDFIAPPLTLHFDVD